MEQFGSIKIHTKSEFFDQRSGQLFGILLGVYIRHTYRTVQHGKHKNRPPSTAAFAIKGANTKQHRRAESTQETWRSKHRDDTFVLNKELRYSTLIIRSKATSGTSTVCRCLWLLCIHCCSCRGFSLLPRLHGINKYYAESITVFAQGGGNSKYTGLSWITMVP